MKKIILISIFLLFSKMANAMFANVIYRAMPPNPTFNIPEEVQEVANNVNSTITQVNDLKNKVEEDVSNKICELVLSSALDR